VSTTGAAVNWLAQQDGRAVLIAREIITRREALTRMTPSNSGKPYQNGFVAGLRLALSYLGERPGDISQTGAEGFIVQVESADRMLTEKAETVLTARHAGKDTDPRRNTPEAGR
jgi:hypothetical protein